MGGDKSEAVFAARLWRGCLCREATIYLYRATGQREGTHLGVFVLVWLVLPRCEATNLGVFDLCHFDLLKRGCANSGGFGARRQRTFVDFFFEFAWGFGIEKWRGHLVNFLWSRFHRKQRTKNPRKIGSKIRVENLTNSGTFRSATFLT